MNDDGIDEIDELDDDVAALLADPAAWAEPSADLEERVVASIGTARVAAPAISPAASSADPPPLPGDRTSTRRWRERVLGAAVGSAAAALIVGIVLGGFDDADRADGGVALGSLALVGTDLAPGISGSARVRQFEPGVEVAITLAGLPRRDDGEFYQGWLKRCDGTGLVSIGTFHDLSSVEGWAGVDIAEFPIVTVTRERVAGPTDAAQGSSGEVVVTGTLRPCPEP
jgi:hypothetical protein